MLTAGLARFDRFLRDAVWAGPDEVRVAVRICVWTRWVAAVTCVFFFLYRPAELPAATYLALYALVGILIVSNALLHLRVLSPRPMPAHWMLGDSLADNLMVTAAVIASGGFTHYFVFLLYYPALALFAVVFPSTRVNLAWVTGVAAVYTAVCVFVGDGIDLASLEERTVLARVVIMYLVSMVVNLVLGVERSRRMESMERERALVRERLEVSQAIHDTASQTAYMVAMGIDNARALAEDAPEGLKSSLAAASELSRSMVWELRRPVDSGRLFEGARLGPVLRSHVETFRRITSVNAVMVQSGEEPVLDLEVRRRLFAIAHNALTNAFRHSGADLVEVSLDFQPDSVRMSVRDNGTGLPPDHESRGRGFAGMRADAGSLGGSLSVGSGLDGVGTAVVCTIPSGGS